MKSDPRLSSAALKVLKYLLENLREQRSGAEMSRAVNVGSGTLYPLLGRLEEAGWLKSKWEIVDPSEVGRPRRRLYKLTALGQTKALAAVAELQVSPGVLAWNT